MVNLIASAASDKVQEWVRDSSELAAIEIHCIDGAITSLRERVAPEKFAEYLDEEFTQDQLAELSINEDGDLVLFIGGNNNYQNWTFSPVSLHEWNAFDSWMIQNCDRVGYVFGWECNVQSRVEEWSSVCHTISELFSDIEFDPDPLDIVSFKSSSTGCEIELFVGTHDQKIVTVELLALGAKPGAEDGFGNRASEIEDDCYPADGWVVALQYGESKIWHSELSGLVGDTQASLFDLTPEEFASVILGQEPLLSGSVSATSESSCPLYLYGLGGLFVKESCFDLFKKTLVELVTEEEEEE